MGAWRIACALGASLPVLVVGGVATLSRVLDPPGEVPKEESRRAYDAYMACNSLADIIESTSYELYYMTANIEHLPRDLVIRRLKDVLERYEGRFYATLTWAEAWARVEPGFLSDVFPYGVYGAAVIKMASLILNAIERGESPSDISRLAEGYLKDIASSVRRSFVTCLSKLGALDLLLKLPR